MEERIKKLETEIQKLKERNNRVETDKAWETSGFRIFSITVITYAIAVVVMYIIGVQNYFLSALIPTIGYYLSMQSLPIIRNWWLKRSGCNTPR